MEGQCYNNMEQLIKAKEFLLSQGFLHPEIGIVLGTGLNKFLNLIEIPSIASPVLAA